MARNLNAQEALNEQNNNLLANMNCLTWNLEWASPTSSRSELIREFISEAEPDVACYTEVTYAFMPERYCLFANADYGYSNSADRRKVALWSKHPWSDVDAVGDESLPTGRFISGVTAGIRFIGVCIPWKDAHVRTGRKDRLPWEDHLLYCDGLKRVIQRYIKNENSICILGDFNQRIPRESQPESVFRSLMSAFPSTFRILTEGKIDDEGNSLIDHIVVSPDLVGTHIKIIPRFSPDRTRLSDHVGVVSDIISKDCIQQD